MDRVISVKILTALLLLTIPIAARAGSLAPPLCAPADLDVTFAFGDMPEGRQTLSVNFRNDSAISCTLHGEAGPNFSDYRQGRSVPFTAEWMTKPDGAPDFERRERESDLTLAAGTMAHVTYSWASKGSNCVEADGMNTSVNENYQNSYLISTRSWIMTLCSAVEVSPYSPGEAESPVIQGALDVSATPATVFTDELSILHLRLRTKNQRLSLQPCPPIYTVERSVDGSTRLDEVDSKGLVYRPSPDDPMKTIHSCTLGAVPSADANVPAETLARVTHVLVQADSKDTGHRVLVTAPTKFVVLDPESLEPHWGKEVQGIRAGLSVDRTTFGLGEFIPIHVLWQVLANAGPIGSTECYSGPEIVMADRTGAIIKRIDPSDGVCSGHGWGPFRVEPGKRFGSFIAISTKKTLDQGLSLSAVPGIYTLTAVWTPRSLQPLPEGSEPPSPIRAGVLGPVYATAESKPVQIRVVSKRKVITRCEGILARHCLGFD